MTQTKHTPGPWIVRGYGESSSHRLTITGATSPIAIAEIVPQTMKAYDEAAEANGRLIAAAPDLLEATENSNIEILATLESAVALSSINRDMLRARLEANRAVIDKATEHEA